MASEFASYLEWPDIFQNLQSYSFTKSKISQLLTERMMLFQELQVFVCFARRDAHMISVEIWIVFLRIIVETTKENFFHRFIVCFNCIWSCRVRTKCIERMLSAKEFV